VSQKKAFPFPSAVESKQDVFALQIILTCRGAIENNAQSLPFVHFSAPKLQRGATVP
jgi:hypothetical protein